MKTKRSDFTLRDEGTIFLLSPASASGWEWVEQFIPSNAQWWGVAVVVEHRYIEDIKAGIKRDGLTLTML